jgi:protocatechuate 3,4-dioxygenase alpha subunit
LSPPPARRRRLRGASLRATPSQTVGPFFSIGCSWLQREDLAPGAAGGRVTLQGRVTDGDGAPVPDAMLELWQADARGRYGEPGFAGFGRVPTDADGRYRFTTVKPGGAPGPRGTTQAPHVAVSLFARGLMRRLVTRIYFPDEPANASDFVLSLVAPDRRGTLIARALSDGALEWDVVLQGAGETVFFDCF